MKISKRITAILLILSLALSSAFMTSCNLMALISNGALDFNDNGGGNSSGNITVQGGDTNVITINSSSESNVLAASKAVLSVVSIYSEFERSYSSGWGSESFASAGSGVIYKLDKERGDAYVITNYHVIHHADDNSEKQIARKIRLYLYGMEASEYAIDAEFVGGSMLYDLAVLKVTGSTVLMQSVATAATVADSNGVSLLDTVIAIGNPDAKGLSATVGYINVDSENISLLASDEKTTMTLRVMRVDAALNSGNSGGGLFDAEGNLIGIVNAKRMTSDGMGYAIPSNIAKYVSDNVLYYCNGQDKTSVQKCILGVTLTPAELYTAYDTETGKIHKHEKIKVTEIIAGSIADGVFRVGDIINSITIDGAKHDVTRMFHLIDPMLNARVGSRIVVNLQRDGDNIELTVNVTADTLTEYK